MALGQSHPDVRDAGFEPAVSAWKADVLPLTPITRKTQALPSQALRRPYGTRTHDLLIESEMSFPDSSNGPRMWAAEPLEDSSCPRPW